MSEPDVNQNSNDRWLSVEEAARKVGVSVPFIYSTLKRGKLSGQQHQVGELVLLSDVLELRNARRMKQQKGRLAREREQKRAQRREELAHSENERVGKGNNHLKPLAEAVLEAVSSLGRARASEVHQALIRQYGASYNEVRGSLLTLTDQAVLRRDDDRRYCTGDTPDSAS